MSLLNDMLRDLNERHRQGDTSTADASLPQQRGFRLQRLLLALGALGVLVLVIGGLWRYQPLPRDAGDSQATVTPVRVPVARVPEIESLPVVAEPSPRVLEVSPDSATPVTNEAVAPAVPDGPPLSPGQGDSKSGDNQPPETSARADRDKVPTIAATDVIETAAQTRVVPPPVVRRSEPQLPADQVSYQRGLKDLQRGDVGSALSYFQEALRLNPDLLSARLQLISVLEQRAPEDVAGVLRAGLARQPEQPLLRKLYAQQLLQQQRPEEAVALLQHAPQPAVDADAEYHALLAALLQEIRDYEAAAKLYVRLLQFRPQEALWWLGLGICLEQQGASAQARQAYQSALAVSGLRPDLERYVRSRLQVL